MIPATLAIAFNKTEEDISLAATIYLVFQALTPSLSGSVWTETGVYRYFDDSHGRGYRTWPAADSRVLGTPALSRWVTILIQWFLWLTEG
jgi:hypothetical protein